MGKGRSRKEENTLGMSGLLLRKQNIYSPSLAGSSGDRSRVGAGLGGWALGPGAVVCHPASAPTPSLGTKDGRTLRAGVGLGHLSSQHPAHESPLSLLPSRTSYKFVGPSAK